MIFLKEHLTGQYEWAPDTSTSTYTGSPTRRLFNRFNGDQVLFIINLYGSLSPNFSIWDGQKMEELLQNLLPVEAKSEISVFNWLREALGNNLEEKTKMVH